MNRTTRTAITTAVTLVAGFGLLGSQAAVAADASCADVVPYVTVAVPAMDRWSAAMRAVADGPLQDAPMSEWLELYDASTDGLAAIEPLTPPAVLTSTDAAVLVSMTTGRDMSEAVISDDVFAGLPYGDDLETNSTLLDAATAELTAACSDLDTI